MKNAAIIVTIGDELLIGQTVDTSSAWISQELNKIGVRILRHTSIPDTEQAIVNTLDDYIPQAGLIILTGGLGPTNDDITKLTLSNYFGSMLRVNDTVLEQIKILYAKRLRPFHLESIQKQAEVPDYCTILMNQLGTAPGMWFEQGDCIVVSLPGVPFEMQHLMQQQVIPRLKSRLNTYHILHHTLIITGIGETAIAEKIEDIEQSLPPALHLAYLPAPGMVKLRLSIEGPEWNQLQEKVNEYATRITERLGDHVMATKDIALEELLKELLLARKFTLALAESCTGGYLAHRITNISGSSMFFKGGLVTYANQAKRRLLQVTKETLNTDGAVSEATVIQMARQARKLLKADISLSISGILGPDGGTPAKPVGTVWMALSTKGKVVTRQFIFPYGRLQNKEMAANTALSMLIRYLKEH